MGYKGLSVPRQFFVPVVTHRVIPVVSKLWVIQLLPLFELSVRFPVVLPLLEVELIKSKAVP